MTLTAFSGHRRGASIAGKALAVAAAAILALTGCSSTGSSSNSSKGSSQDFGTVNVQLSWIKDQEFAGEYFGLEKGYFKDAGFSKVNLIDGPSTGATELLSGKADIALSDAASIGSVVAKQKAPLKIIGATYQKNPFTILSLTDKGDIKTPQDMEGKKIGVQDSNTNLFKAFLKVNNIPESSVTVVPVQYDPSVLVNGQVDGWVGYVTNEEVVLKAEVGQDKITGLPLADNGLPFVAETVTTTDKTIKEKPAMLRAFLKAEIQGWSDNVNDPEQGAKYATDKYGKDKKLNLTNEIAGNTAQVNELVTSPETEKNGLFTISDQLQDESIASLKAAGISVKKSDLFDMSLLNQVYKDNPKLVNYKK